MCKWVWLDQQAGPVVVELPVERVGEGLELVGAGLQEKSFLELPTIEELVHCARLAHLKELHDTNLLKKIYIDHQICRYRKISI